MLFAMVKKWLSPFALSWTDSKSTIMVTGAAKHDDLLAVPPSALHNGRSSPLWMTHGFNDSHAYEDHTELFPIFPVFTTASDELAAMRAANAQADLLTAPHPRFKPDLTPIDGMNAVRAALATNDDISIHKEEARDALRMALHFAAGKAKSRFQHTHPAFASPANPYQLFSSPLAGEMMKYIGRTYGGCRNSIRVAPPSQIRNELETCLIFAFAEYVLSGAFTDAEGKNKLLPEFVVHALEKGLNGDPVTTREIIDACEEGFIEGADEFVKIWAAWRWVLRIYVGALVLRDRRRQEDQIVWC